MSSLRRCFFSFLFLMLCLPVSAFSEDQLLLDEIVIKGQETPPSGEILTIRDVRESPARDIGEALKQVDGIDIVRKGAIANFTAGAPIVWIHRLFISISPRWKRSVSSRDRMT